MSAKRPSGPGTGSRARAGGSAAGARPIADRRAAAVAGFRLIEGSRVWDDECLVLSKRDFERHAH
jgi:hypothetical protein